MRKIIGALISLVLVLPGFASTRPDSFRVELQTSVNAPYEKVFANLQNFTLKPPDGTLQVTWAVYGISNLI